MSDGAMAYPHIDRIRRLRKSRGEVWQGAIVRVPQWVVEEGQPPVRPILAVWFSMNSGRINTGALRKPSERDPAMLLDAMAGEGGGGQGIPGIRPETRPYATAVLTVMACSIWGNTLGSPRRAKAPRQ